MGNTIKRKKMQGISLDATAKKKKSRGDKSERDTRPRGKVKNMDKRTNNEKKRS